MKNDTIRLSIDIPKNLHKALKFYVINHETTIKDFFLDLVENNMPEEIEDYMLGKMAYSSKKEGSLGRKGSEKLLQNLKSTIKKTNK